MKVQNNVCCILTYILQSLLCKLSLLGPGGEACNIPQTYKHYQTNTLFSHSSTSFKEGMCPILLLKFFMLKPMKDKHLQIHAWLYASSSRHPVYAEIQTQKSG